MTDDLISPAAVMAQREHSATTTTHKSNQSAPVVIDVRSEEEYAAGHIAGALHIPADELADRLDEIPKDRPVVPY